MINPEQLQEQLLQDPQANQALPDELMAMMGAMTAFQRRAKGSSI